MKITWARQGGYEVSSRGDPRFSALNAAMFDGRTLEAHYQCDIKAYDPGGVDWRLGKGKPPLDLTMTREAIWEAYLDLWRTWALNHPALMEELRGHAIAHGCILSDRFANTSINQARALADLLNEVSEYHDFSTFE